jgi:hypothetical protein
MINAGQVFVDLGARLDRKEFDLYERELKKVQERTARREHFRAELGANFDQRAFNAYERELKKAERHNDDMVKANGRLRTSFGSVWSRGGAAFAAAGGAAAVVAGVRSITKASGEAEASQKRMEAQLKASGISYKAHADEIDNVIQKTSKLAALDDEDLQDAFTNLVRSTGSVSKGLNLVGLAADIARAKHLDVAKAAEIVGKVANGNTGVLGRYGISVRKGADATEALGQLQDKFRGQAEAYGKTQQGAMDRVGVAFENLQETLGKRLGPTITRAANSLARFIDQMQTGEGAGGRFAHGLERIADGAKIAISGFNLFARSIRIGAGQIAGLLSRLLGGFSSIASFLSHIPGLGFLKGIARGIDDARDSLDRFKKAMDVGVATRDMEDKIGRLRSRTNQSLDDIRKDTASNMREIKRRLGTDSKEGADNLTANFRAARTAVRRAMRDGTVSTREGMAEIKRLTRAELRELGIANLAKAGTSSAAAENARAQITGRYAGGWIGARGQAGPDTVPAMLGVGEAVLNRHQQAVIEGLLGDGFLDRLFATVTRPHYLAGGGRAGLQPAVSRLANSLASRFGLQITSTTGGTHAPNSFHYQGLAADLGGSGEAMSRASSWLMSSGTYRSLLEGIHKPGLSVKDGAVVPSGFWGGVWDQHANHIHVALRALGALAGGASGLWRDIRAPRVDGSGAMQAIVGGRLTQAVRAINRAGRARVASMGGADTGDLPGAGVSGGGGNAANRSLARRLLSSFGFGDDQWPPLASLWTRESNFSTTATNKSSGAYGIPQSLPANKMASAGSDWRTNPATQIRWGLGYIRDRYGSPARAWAHEQQFGWYARGGRALPRGIGKATAGLVRRVKPLQSDRSSQFDALMARVQAADDNYSRWERRFNVTDEELVDADTGALNVGAIQRKARELGQLLLIRAGMERDLDAARAVARRVVASYRRVIGALRRSLRHAKGKDRSGIRSYISTYQTRLNEWQGKVSETGDSLFDTHTDVLSLRGELKEVLGTAPQIQAPDTATSDLSPIGDSGGTDATPADTTTTPPTPLQIAEAAAQELRTFLSAAQDTFTNFGGNALTPQAAFGAGGVFSGSPDQLSAFAGVRNFGAAGGGVVHNWTVNYAAPPDNAVTWAEQMRFNISSRS